MRATTAAMVFLVSALGAAPARADEQCPAGDADALVQCSEASATSIPEFDTLRPSDSPAFTILGVAPTEVQKPSTPREVVASLSKFVDASGDLLVPDNLAIEIAPFWLVGGRTVELGDIQRGGAASLYRNIGLSIGARSATRALADAMGEREVTDKDLAVGLRTVYDGEVLEDGCKVLLERLQALAAETALQPTAEEMALPAEERLQHMRERKAALAERVDSAEAGLAEASEPCAKALTARKRSIEIAGAMRWFFPAGVSDEGRIRGASAWATLASSWTYVTLVGLVRYAGDKPAGDWAHNVDLGVQAVLTRDRYAASLEAIGRYAGGADDGDVLYRVALAADYMIGDGKWLTFSFGKDFAEDDAGSLFSLANLTYAFGEPRIGKRPEATP